MTKRKINKPLKYLAGPFSNPDQKIMDERKVLHAKLAVLLKNRGESIYAPIPETTCLTELGGLSGTSWKDWREHDLNLLQRCDELYVMLIQGWRESLGVRGEVKFAIQNNIPIRFINMEGELFRLNVFEMFLIESEEELND